MRKRKPRRLWIGYVRAILQNYPHVTDREREAVELAVTETTHQSDGETVRAIIEMVFFRRSHTLDGAAQAVHYSYSAAKRMQQRFLVCVGKHMGLP